MRTVAAFDFDGTITKKDTFLHFIIFTKGCRAFFMGFFIHLPLLIALKLKLYPNWKAKQILFSYFYRGMSYKEFQRWGEAFADKIEKMKNKQNIEILRRHLKDGDKVYVISASIEDWIRPFCFRLGVTAVLGTKVEIDSNGKLTGKFLTKNCYGSEKVSRLLEMELHRSEYFLYAYGDSSGDKEMLEFADKGIKV